MVKRPLVYMAGGFALRGVLVLLPGDVGIGILMILAPGLL